MSDTPLFKTKKRKPLRQRSPSPETAEPASTEDAIQDALRLRRKRRGGPSRPTDTEHRLVLREEEGRVKGIPDRFTHQTGFVADMDDKHMYVVTRWVKKRQLMIRNAYIESRLRNAVPDDAPSAEQPTQPPQAASQPAKVVEQPTRYGKLVEVDLPQLEERQRKVKEPRRRRNRRGSDDIKRDQLVEAFLSENRLDVYEAPTQSTTSGPAADERLAEEFKRQYMDEVSMRRQKRRPAINQPKSAAQQQATSDDVLKGPKLGGSRNARSAVRDALLSKQIGDKKK